MSSAGQLSLSDFSVLTAVVTMSNCTCFFVFFCDPSWFSVETLEAAKAEATAGANAVARDLTGLRSSVVNDAGFFSMDLTAGVVPAVNDCDRLAGPDAANAADLPHRRRGGLTGDWSVAVEAWMVVVAWTAGAA